MGRSRIRAEPSSTHVPGVPASSAVRKRIAVPACPTSILPSVRRNASCITRVSSHSANPRSSAFTGASAFITNARFDRLFEAGRATLPSISNVGIFIRFMLSDFF